MEQQPCIIAIVGPNASGKSNLGVALAKKYQGEVVSADSRQVFQGLNLGSGKINPAEMQGVTHHLLDVCKAGDFFSMADFQRLAYAAIEDVRHRGKLPFLVGGTGLYIASVTEGYELLGHRPNLDYRKELEQYTSDDLYAMLLKKTPDTQVDSHNRNRIMRLLERLHDGDCQPQGRGSRYHSLKLGITWDREVLQHRIRVRLERRLQEGMIQEVQGLLDAGVSQEFLLKLGLEYRLITQYLTGVIQSYEELNQLLFIAIRQLAKRQMTWFRRDQNIHWLNMEGNPLAEASDQIDRFLSSQRVYV
ncbi:MAG: tRNA (adenosine(37)-N6)-dimethylallyltransferase MiaA [Clostridia bacterium]|nr:tRNA (adenosine(37)-N6)-dimethylallyltransferase MiaA [Clostridia bacterium]